MSKAILKILGINFVALAVLLPGFAQAQELKIGFVDLQWVMQKYPERKVEVDLMTKEFEAKQKEMLALQSEIQALSEKAMRDELTMKEAERKDIEQKVLLKDRNLRTKKAFYDEDLKIRQNQIQNKLLTDIRKAIIAIAQRDKYDLIVHDGVIFNSERVNVSAEVLEELKKLKK